MSGTAPVLLDEHVGRVFEHVLRSRGYRVEQAKDRFGEYTTDEDLLHWWRACHRKRHMRSSRVRKVCPAQPQPCKVWIR